MLSKRRTAAGLDWSLTSKYLPLFGMLAVSSSSAFSISRTEFYVDSDPEISIYVREIRDQAGRGENGPILLIHGARVPGVASFDLQVPGGSLAEDLAWNAATSLLAGWDKSIPLDDKDRWRDPAVAKAYVHEALASDPEATHHSPLAFRSPNGAMEDSFYLATGRQLWDASFIKVPTLIIASARDFWSRPEDRELLLTHLVHAPIKQLVTIPDATHFVHLDRNEHGRQQFLDALIQFCQTRNSP